jgi:hypothetical protein
MKLEFLVDLFRALFIGGTPSLEIIITVVALFGLAVLIGVLVGWRRSQDEPPGPTVSG